LTVQQPSDVLLLNTFCHEIFYFLDIAGVNLMGRRLNRRHAAYGGSLWKYLSTLSSYLRRRRLRASRRWNHRVRALVEARQLAFAAKSLAKSTILAIAPLPW
jgi:hypothetical protein